MEKESDNTILYYKHADCKNIAYIVLNRPEKNNTVSLGPGHMTEKVMNAIKAAEWDDDVKVIIFKGNGKNFCTGYDLSQVYFLYGGSVEVRPPQSSRLRMDEDHVVGIRNAIVNCKKVTIAQVQGWCVEGGLHFVECSDLAIAAKNAKLTHRGQRLAFGGSASIPLLLLMGRTKKIIELLLTGRTISGDEAEEIGIITKAVEPEILEEEVYNLARAISLTAGDALAIGKMQRRLIFESIGLSNMMIPTISHTMSTNIRYRPEEKDIMFLRDREKIGTRAALHKLHEQFEEALNKTKYFKSYTDGE